MTESNTQQRANDRQRIDLERLNFRREINALRHQVAQLEEQASLVKQLQAENASLKQLLKQSRLGDAIATSRVPATTTPVQRASKPAPVQRGPAAVPRPRPKSTYSVEQQGERRQQTRRKGNPVPVSMTGAGWIEPLEGWVLDRSAAGLALRVDQQMTVGAAMKIHSSHVPTAPWIEIHIRYCEPDGNSFRIGCQFTHELSWPELQQFG